MHYSSVGHFLPLWSTLPTLPQMYLYVFRRRCHPHICQSKMRSLSSSTQDLVHELKTTQGFLANSEKKINDPELLSFHDVRGVRVGCKYPRRELALISDVQVHTLMKETTIEQRECPMTQTVLTCCWCHNFSFLSRYLFIKANFAQVCVGISVMCRLQRLTVNLLFQ